MAAILHPSSLGCKIAAPELWEIPPKFGGRNFAPQENGTRNCALVIKWGRKMGAGGAVPYAIWWAQEKAVSSENKKDKKRHRHSRYLTLYIFRVTAWHFLCRMSTWRIEKMEKWATLLTFGLGVFLVLINYSVPFFSCADNLVYAAALSVPPDPFHLCGNFASHFFWGAKLWPPNFGATWLGCKITAPPL